MGKPITDRVTWVGKIDWELKRFHGDEYSTDHGSSYNSYLIRDGKTILLDTVWQPFEAEYIQALKDEVDLAELDAIICQHAEIDHSGALAELVRERPDIPIYCTANGVKIIKGMFHGDWNFQVVKTGDMIELDSGTLTFVEAPMLHWPDTMFTYYSADEILFSNDGFGQHYASQFRYNDEVDQAELYREARKYYANILTPFSAQVTRKINEILAMNLPLKMICPSHGVIWRENPAQIIEQYLTWADKFQQNQITIVYDSMWHSTRLMAEAIGSGISKADPSVEVKIFNAAKSDKNDILTEIFCSKAVLVGAYTINNGISYAISGILEMVCGLKFKNKKAAAFGSYGWSGEGNKHITELLRRGGFEIVNEGIKLLWKPDEAALEQCSEFGAEFVKAL
ncbi:MAG: anaerobic nitric oxide reductase flavorubredoxin [Ruminococcaceae bacterium]|nr:anaerobic nitric oxide reductase flavorubredoxin [Oscillospiraceae bacterium]